MSTHLSWFRGIAFAVLVAGQVMRLAATDSDSGAGVLFKTVDLNKNEVQEVELVDGTRVRVKLAEVNEKRDTMRKALRGATVKLELNGKLLVLTSAPYHLPVTFAGLQIDCPVTKGTEVNNWNSWGLRKDARLRLWPAGSPWLEPGSFVYPLKQRWFASHTQMANEPVFVDECEVPGTNAIHYHWGLDFGGAEGMVDVVAATAGRVISAGKENVRSSDDSPMDGPDEGDYDWVHLVDERGWHHGYNHLQSIDPGVRPGTRIRLGQKIGVLGKEGGSGGWSHLHYEVWSRLPSGIWGIQEAYPFVWEAYRRELAPKILAVARPHHFVQIGEKLTLDGSKSWSSSGTIARYDWMFTDGSTSTGVAVERTYREPGEYSETLMITDAQGEVDYDSAIVLVVDPSSPDQLPPTIHPAFAPTMDIHPGDPVTFKVRTFGTTAGAEIWDFGDGSQKVTVKSDGNVNALAKNGYAVTQHQFSKRGHYLVRVERTNERGQRAVGHLSVRVD